MMQDCYSNPQHTMNALEEIPQSVLEKLSEVLAELYIPVTEPGCVSALARRIQMDKGVGSGTTQSGDSPNAMTVTPNAAATCTCGACTAGVLSPRLRLKMTALADCITKVMKDATEDFVSYASLQPDLVLHDLPLRFVDTNIRAAGVFKSFYTGYRQMFLEIAWLLRNQPGIVPTEEAVKARLAHGSRRYRVDFKQKYCDFFFAHGGSVRDALQCLLHEARRTSKWPFGDGTFERSIYAYFPPSTPGGDRWSLWENRTHLHQEWEALPSCFNDIAYEGVSGLMGISQSI
ncbi:hypothetical protein OBBRIDRAFT_829532 [Obba rivulosa]|uniref:Uncharacterized protein n=1 Tax=Obba rivulosa TaxID=1052685 RepID=A0A8E2DJ29_9APHY|nr:hypothetical protein OBBRIDRAFT_829532 [Obba rivulosa]